MQCNKVKCDILLVYFVWKWDLKCVYLRFSLEIQHFPLIITTPSHVLVEMQHYGNESDSRAARPENRNPASCLNAVVIKLNNWNRNRMNMFKHNSQQIKQNAIIRI